MTTKEKKPKRTKRRFDEQFRRDAVALVESTGKPPLVSARQLGISHWNLYDWIEIYGQGASTQASTVEDLQRVIARLQSEKESIQAERDVLKKSAGHPCNSCLFPIRYHFPRGILRSLGTRMN